MSELTITQLEAAVAGRVIAPHDPEYDEARAVFYAGYDRRPVAVVRPADAHDVARVVRLAADTGTELAVRSGGHSPAGHGVTEGGVVIDMGSMRTIGIDTVSSTAWAETGLTAGEYTAAAGAQGLATGFGDTGSVGIGGITLSGGLGFLLRKHGLTIDSLIGAEIVTADGRILTVDADHHPDLFWAIRGGGGNFGVATRFNFRLHPVSEIVGGMLILPATPHTIAGFVAEAAQAPDELSTIANVMVAPPMPFLPPEVHGKLVLLGLMANVGGAEAGEKAMAPFRALAEPLADMLQPMTYPELFPEEEMDFKPLAASRTMFADGIDSGDITTLLERVQTSTAMAAAVQLRVLGGAMARVPADATAFAHRNSQMMINVAAMYQDPDDGPEHEKWVEDLSGALHQGDDGAYVGFMVDDPERVANAYPGATGDRLREIKRHYDPDNLFRLNQNIDPA